MAIKWLLEASHFLWCPSRESWLYHVSLKQVTFHIVMVPTIPLTNDIGNTEFCGQRGVLAKNVLVLQRQHDVFFLDSFLCGKFFYYFTKWLSLKRIDKCAWLSLRPGVRSTVLCNWPYRETLPKRGYTYPFRWDYYGERGLQNHGEAKIYLPEMRMWVNTRTSVDYSSVSWICF